MWHIILDLVIRLPLISRLGWPQSPSRPTRTGQLFPNRVNADEVPDNSPSALIVMLFCLWMGRWLVPSSSEVATAHVCHADLLHQGIEIRSGTHPILLCRVVLCESRPHYGNDGNIGVGLLNTFHPLRGVLVCRD